MSYQVHIKIVQVTERKGTGNGDDRTVETPVVDVSTRCSTLRAAATMVQASINAVESS